MTPTITVKTISIKGFRGIPELDLELEGKSLVLKGENGTGKSSIVDSIEFFFTGGVSHLEGVKGLSLMRHAPHTNFSSRDVEIAISFDPGNVRLTRTFLKAPSVPNQFKDYFDECKTGTMILHRSQILEFINSQPAERFRAIGSIIGLEALDTVELEIMRARDDLAGKARSNLQAKERILTELSEILGGDIEKIKDVLPALNRILKKAKLPPIASMDETGVHAEKMLKRVRKRGNAEQITRLGEVIGNVKADFISKDFLGKLTTLDSMVRKLLQDGAKSKVTLVSLLQAGRHIIEQEQPDTCPICEQRIERETLLARLLERIKLANALSQTAAEIRQAAVPILDALKAVEYRMQSIASGIEHLKGLSTELETLHEAMAFVASLSEEISSARDLEKEFSISSVPAQRVRMDMLRSSIARKCKRILSRIDLTAEEKRALGLVRVIEQVHTKTIDLLQIESEWARTTRYHGLAERIYSAFSAVKKSKIQRIYRSIQGDVQSYYLMLHPNEPHKDVELDIAMGRRASTVLRMESFGRKGQDPRALASEGHLDSMGLCIFLAFVKSFNKDCPFVVLDDVVTTIDARHRESICKLLLEKFDSRQLIITTHDGVWYEQLLSAQRAYGVDGRFKNMIVSGWNLEAGPRISGYKPRWERIKGDLSSGDKAAAGNEGRRYLEWLLERVCDATEAPVPYNRSGRYEIRDLLGPAKVRLKSLIANAGFRDRVLDSFKHLELNIIMGNLLSHDNVLAEQVAMGEVEGFCEAVRSIHASVSCPHCEQLLGYYRDLRIMRCSNPRCSMPFEVECN